MTGTHTATGTFSVRMQPLVDAQASEGVSLGRLKLSKQFEGDLVATGEARCSPPPRQCRARPAMWPSSA